MVRRSGRKSRSKKTARTTLTFVHYQFKGFLSNKAFEYRKTVVEVLSAKPIPAKPTLKQVK